MPRFEGCSPYAIAVGVLIGIFIGREDAPEQGQVCKAGFFSECNSKGLWFCFGRRAVKQQQLQQESRREYVW